MATSSWGYSAPKAPAPARGVGQPYKAAPTYTPAPHPFYNSMVPQAGGGGGGYAPQGSVPNGGGVAPPAYSSGPNGPGPYPATPAPQPARPPLQGGVPLGAPQSRVREQANIAQRQEAFLGDAASLFPLSPSRPLTRADIPLADFAEQFRQQELSERDRMLGYNELARGRGAIGQTPEDQLLMELLQGRARGGGGEFSDPLMDILRGSIRDRGAVGLRDSQEAMREEFARRGIVGAPTAGELSRLALSSSMGTQQQIADLELQAAQGREEAARSALGQLQGIQGQRESERAALDQALANVFLDTERTPIDFSGLVTPVKKGGKKIGGKKGAKTRTQRWTV